MTTVACIEVGASGCQTVLFAPDGALTIAETALAPAGSTLLMAAPGIIDGVKVFAASNLDWWDADPLTELGLTGELALLLNDADAAALGEWALRGASEDLVFVGLGTGVGGAVVNDGVVTANLFGHLDGYSSRLCNCGLFGCLETVAAGWALPDPLSDPVAVAVAVADAITRTDIAGARRVVLAGGMTAAHPELVGLLAAQLPDRTVEGSAAPAGAKSAAAWGLLHEHERSCAFDAA